MKRREFFGVFGGAATAWPLAALAQQAVPTVGILRTSARSDSLQLVAALRQGLKEAGFVEGKSVVIEERYADNKIDRLPILAGELMRGPVHLIVANTVAALTAKGLTSSVPIVFVTGSDPIRDGLVRSLNRPGGNVTGVVFPSGVVGAKRLEVFRQFVPAATNVAVLVNPDNPELMPSAVTSWRERRPWACDWLLPMSIAT